MICVTRIDRLIDIARRAVGGGVEVSYVTITYLEDDRWEVRIDLWDYVPFSGRGRKDWRIIAYHNSFVDVIVHIEEMIDLYPGCHDITILFNDIERSGHFFTVTV